MYCPAPGQICWIVGPEPLVLDVPKFQPLPIELHRRSRPAHRANALPKPSRRRLGRPCDDQHGSPRRLVIRHARPRRTKRLDRCQVCRMMARTEPPLCTVSTRNGELRLAIGRSQERMLGERRRVVQRTRPLCGFDVITIYRAPMTDNVKYWTSVLREAERELEAATTRAAMNAAGKKLMDAKAQVKRLQARVAAAGGGAVSRDYRGIGSSAV
jgi:hypothetical protein